MRDLVQDLDDSELMRSLDENRQVVVRKLDGLSFEQATTIVTYTGVTLLGVVKHLAWVERAWFLHHLLGRPAPAGDIDESFAVHTETSVDDVVDDYREACAQARRVVAESSSLEVQTVVPHWAFGTVTLRWILLHMIRETARHAGHLDILRELTDGETGF
jgi:uncharacterized damage-inducible protein DinB